jgi:hypothetical protein
MSLKSPSTQEEIITHSFNGHDFLRPNDTIRCTGCHKGHMFVGEQAFSARANLARLAVASASSEINTFYYGAHRVKAYISLFSKGCFGVLGLTCSSEVTEAEESRINCCRRGTCM